MCFSVIHYALLPPQHVTWFPPWAAHNWTHQWAALPANIPVGLTEFGRLYHSPMSFKAKV